MLCQYTNNNKKTMLNLRECRMRSLLYAMHILKRNNGMNGIEGKRKKKKVVQQWKYIDERHSIHRCPLQQYRGLTRKNCSYMRKIETLDSVPDPDDRRLCSHLIGSSTNSCDFSTTEHCVWFCVARSNPFFPSIVEKVFFNLLHFVYVVLFSILDS
jgi:hypothetical protein